MNHSGPKLMLIFGICVGFIALVAMAQGGPECESLGGDCADGSGWDPMQKLNEIGTGNYDQSQSGGTKWPEKSRVVRWNKTVSGFEDDTIEAPEKVIEGDSKLTEPKTPMPRSDDFLQALVPIEDISETEILLDISEDAEEHIAGSVFIPYPTFMHDGDLKSISEVSQILGMAGISQSDSIVLYGECLPCGGGPSASTYIYWMMKSLGHQKIRVLDGSVEDWKAAGKPTSQEGAILAGTNYTPEFTPEYIATYDYVKSGQAQIVDARSMQEFGMGSIPGAIPIPYESVLDGKKIKDGASLKRVFAILSRDRPVVVYTNTGIKASVVWFALELMGYDAQLYSWQNWLANQLPPQNSSD